MHCSGQTPRSANGHIFMLTNFDFQSDGYKIWIDKDQMEGSTLEAMASAVENAWVVLICVSAHYKESSDCRTGMLILFEDI